MGFFGRKKRDNDSGGGSRFGELYTLSDIIDEWFGDHVVDPSSDLEAWKAGLARYYSVSDFDEAGVRDAGRAIAQGVRHHLRVDDFLPVPEMSERRDLWLVQSIHNLGVASVIWRSEHSFSSEDERLLRLCLAVMGRYGYQPGFMGGNGDMDETFEDQTFHMATALVVSHGESIGMSDQFFRQFRSPAQFEGSGVVLEA